MDSVTVWGQAISLAETVEAAKVRLKKDYSVRKVNEVNGQIKQPSTRGEIKSSPKTSQRNKVSSQEEIHSKFLNYVNNFPNDLYDDIWVYGQRYNLPVDAVVTRGCRILLDFGDNLDGLFDYCSRNDLQISEALEFAIQLMLRDEEQQYTD